jgi:hypothetical protein
MNDRNWRRAGVRRPAQSPVIDHLLPILSNARSGGYCLGKKPRPDQAAAQMSVGKARAIKRQAARSDGASGYFPCRHERLNCKNKNSGRHHAPS